MAFSLGVLFRLADFSTETDVQAYDLFATVAKGRGIVNVVGAVHYLYYFDNTLPKSATTVAAGVYARLSDTGPTPVMGLTASYGHYAFRELHDVIPEAHKYDRNPHTDRLDVVLSYSGAPDKEKQTSAGLGIRYSRLMPSLLPAYNAFSLVFPSNFSLIK